MPTASPRSTSTRPDGDDQADDHELLVDPALARPTRRRRRLSVSTWCGSPAHSCRRDESASTRSGKGGRPAPLARGQTVAFGDRGIRRNVSTPHVRALDLVGTPVRRSFQRAATGLDRCQHGDLRRHRRRDRAAGHAQARAPQLAASPTFRDSIRRDDAGCGVAQPPQHLGGLRLGHSSRRGHLDCVCRQRAPVGRQPARPVRPRSPS